MALIDFVKQAQPLERIGGSAHVRKREACSELGKGQERAQRSAVPVAKGRTASNSLYGKSGCCFEAWGDGGRIDPAQLGKGGDQFGSVGSVDIVE